MSDRLAAVIAATLDIPADAVTDDLAFNGVKSWDSMNHINLMLALEEAYGITIPDDDLVELSSVGLIRAYLQRVGATAAGPA
jgi:acyl carrier protein